MTKYNKILAFIIVIKRKNSNSFLLHSTFEKMAKNFSISPNSLRLYLRLACEEGYLVKEKNGYRAIDFFTIVKIFCKKHNKKLNYHNLLHKSELNFKKVLDELEMALLFDTCILPQAKYHYLNQSKPSVFKKVSGDVNAAEDNIDTRSTITTSVRQITNKFSYSHRKSARLMMSKNRLFRPVINEKFFKGCNRANIEKLSVLYPGAVIIPLHNSDSIKVCHGTTIILLKKDNSHKQFRINMTITNQIMVAERLLRIEEMNKIGDFNGFNQKQIESMMLKGKAGTKKKMMNSLYSNKWKKVSSVLLT